MRRLISMIATVLAMVVMTLAVSPSARAAVPVSGKVSAENRTTESGTLSLPSPTGSHRIGTVEFPGGRLVVGGVIPAGQADQETLVRTADTRFVLDRLTLLDAGANPDADQQRLPRFRGTLDMTRVGMFGHSHGAESTAETLLHDHRVSAGVGLDGGVSDRVAAAGLPAPYMVISGASAAGHPRTEENLTALWPRMTAWHRWLRLRDAGHLAFTDFETFAPALDMPQDVREARFGTLDPERAVTTERAYLLAFFTQHLDGRHQRLLDRPSPRHPEMIFEDGGAA